MSTHARAADADTDFAAVRNSERLGLVCVSARGIYIYFFVPEIYKGLACLMYYSGDGEGLLREIVCTGSFISMQFNMQPSPANLILGQVHESSCSSMEST